MFYLKDSWYTPNTYDRNFAYPSKKEGVYVIVEPTLGILYVGSSINLWQRYNRHEVLRLLNATYGYVQFYFTECTNSKEFEKHLIKTLQPKYNTQHK